MSLEDRVFSRADDMDDPLWAIAAGLFSVAYALRCLGNGNASTQMGAIEALSVRIGDSIDRIAHAIEAHE